MKILPLALAATAFAVLATGCNSTSSRYAASSDDDEYVYVVDYDKIQRVEKAIQNSAMNLDTYWVNPPVKRVKKSDLASNE